MDFFETQCICLSAWCVPCKHRLKLMSTNLACVLLTFGHHVVGIDFRFKRSKVKVVGPALGGQLGKGGNMFIMLSVCLNSLNLCCCCVCAMPAANECS